MHFRAIPSFATHPRHQVMQTRYIESVGNMELTKQLMNSLSGTLAAAVMVMPLMAMPVQSASSCSALKSEFSKKIRPSILRLAKQEFHLSNWYHATLKKQQAGDHPTLQDIKSTHQAMVANCDTRSDKASCRKFANQMTAASRRIFNVNKRWSAAGCPGRLDR